MKAPVSFFASELGRVAANGTNAQIVALKGEAGAAAMQGPVQRRIAGQGFRELDTGYDPVFGLMHCRFVYRQRPGFTAGILQEVSAALDIAQSSHRESEAVRYVAWGSGTPGIWNLGGDLALLARLIAAGDRPGLVRYAQSVTGAFYRNHVALDSPLITISLVAGDALGIGFEAALSSNVIIAERGARFGLPEVLYNLFPGMGAMSYLARRMAPGLAERIVTSGRIYSAAELYELGVIDVLCEEGGATEALYAFMHRNPERHRMQRGIYEARRRILPLRRQELDDIVDIWVETALGLSNDDLRLMGRLAAAQDRRLG